jgi:hypothetical protein
VSEYGVFRVMFQLIYYSAQCFAGKTPATGSNANDLLPYLGYYFRPTRDLIDWTGSKHGPAFLQNRSEWGLERESALPRMLSWTCDQSLAFLRCSE